MAVKNITASVLARLKQQSKTINLPLQTTLQLFVQEEFLRRLSLSKYVGNMILKGGMFIYTLTEFDSRPTRDIDFMLRNINNSLENIKNVMQEICNVQTGNDFINIQIIGNEHITVANQYPGIKTRFLAKIANVRIPFSIDVGIDDVVIPQPVKRKIVTRLNGFAQPEVFTYSLESTIAEKFDAIICRMSLTSRMKDFYDIYYLSGMFDFDGAVLTEALRGTLQHRNRSLTETLFAEINAFKTNNSLISLWNVFAPAQNAKLRFEIVIQRIIDFLEPIYHCVLQDKVLDSKWICSETRWR
ncbi:MAG: nucleotidyl transferase AbiEii/AbiGii toxin family protein [Bacteroidales bacterium]|nr:nucleotidyl transferase AbiEii/AbiGii toxin family protein [Bacteroidales bacterium]MBR4272260.1 nucleotidyl transferase AbiEii/AbiGii toxin family protein [Bacteroidales bacterium]